MTPRTQESAGLPGGDILVPVPQKRRIDLLLLGIGFGLILGGALIDWVSL